MGTVSFDCNTIAMQAVNPAHELALCNSTNLENARKRAEIKASEEQAWQNFANSVGPAVANQYRPEFDRLTAQNVSEWDEWALANSFVYQDLMDSDAMKAAKILFDASLGKAKKFVGETVAKGAQSMGFDSDFAQRITEGFLKQQIPITARSKAEESLPPYLARDRAFIEKINTMPGGLQAIPHYLHAFQFSGPLKKSDEAQNTYTSWYQESVNNNLSGLWNRKQNQDIFMARTTVNNYINHQNYRYELSQNINQQLIDSGKQPLTDNQMEALLNEVDQTIKSAMGQYAEFIDQSIAYRLLPVEKQVELLQKAVGGLKIELEKLNKNLAKKNQMELSQYLKQQEQLKFKQDLESWQSITGSIVKLAIASGNENLIKGASIADKVSKEVVPGALHVLTGMGSDNPLMIAQGILEVAVAAIDIASIISGNKGPNFQQVVLEKLNKIMDKINELEVKMNAQFCLVNSQLAAIYQEVRNILVSVIREVQLSNEFIVSKLDRLESRLNLLATKVKAIFDVLWFKRLSKTAQSIDNYIERYGNLNRLSEQQFNIYTEELSHWLITDAADPLSTGAFLLPKESQDLVVVNEILSDEEEIDSMIGYLRGYLANLIHTNLLGTWDAQRPVYNPSIWLKAASYYIKLMTPSALTIVPEPSKDDPQYQHKIALHVEYLRQQVIYDNQLTKIKDRDPNGKEQEKIKNIGTKILSQYHEIKNNSQLFVKLFDLYRVKCTSLITEFIKFANTNLGNSLRDKTLETQQTKIIAESLKQIEHEQIGAIHNMPWDPAVPIAFYNQNWHKKTNDQLQWLIQWNNLSNTSVIPFYNDYWTKLNNYSLSYEQKNPQFAGDAPLASYTTVVFADNCQLLLPLAPLFRKEKYFQIPETFLLAERLGLGKFEFEVASLSQLTDFSGSFIVTVSFVLFNSKEDKLLIGKAKLETSYSPNSCLEAIQPYAKLSNYGYGDMSQAYEILTQRTTSKIQYLNAWLNSKVGDVALNPQLQTLEETLQSRYQTDFDKLRKQAAEKFDDELKNSQQKADFKKFQDLILEIDNISKVIKIIARISGMSSTAVTGLQSLLSKEYIRRILGGKVTTLSLDRYVDAHIDTNNKNKNALITLRTTFMQEYQLHSTRTTAFPNEQTHFGISEIVSLLSSHIQKTYGAIPQMNIGNQITFPTPFNPTLPPSRTELLVALFDEIFYKDQQRRYANYRRELPGYLLNQLKSEIKIQLANREVFVQEHSIKADKSILDEPSLSRKELADELQDIAASADDKIRKKIGLEMTLSLLKHWKSWKNHCEPAQRFHERYEILLEQNLTLTNRINALLKDLPNGVNIFETTPIYLIDAVLSTAIDMARSSPDDLFIAGRFMESLTLKYPAYNIVMSHDLHADLRQQLNDTLNFIVQVYEYSLTNAAIQNYFNEYLRDNENATLSILGLELICDHRFTKNHPFPILLWQKNSGGEYKLINKIYMKKFNSTDMVVIDDEHVEANDIATLTNIYWEAQYFIDFTILTYLKDVKLPKQKLDATKEKLLTNERFLRAAKAGDLAEVKAIIPLKPDPWCTDETGRNVVHLVIESGNILLFNEIMQFLVTNNSLCFLERTNEITFDHEPRFELEMNQFFEYALNHSDLSALMLAVRRNHFPFVKALCAIQEKINKKNKFQDSLVMATKLGITPTMIAAAYGYTHSVIELLQNKLKDTHVLEILAAFGHMQNFGAVLREILKQKAIPTADESPISLLSGAAILNNSLVSKYLCLYHYKINIGELINQPTSYTATGNVDYTLLMIAVAHNNLDLMRLYIECGAQINLATLETPVTIAINRRYINALLLLLSNGAILTDQQLSSINQLIIEPNTLSKDDLKNLFQASSQFTLLSLIESCLIKNSHNQFLSKTDIEQAIAVAADATINQLLQQNLKAIVDLENEKLKYLTKEQFQKLQTIGLFNIPDGHHIVFVTGDAITSELKNVEATTINCSGAFAANIGGTPVGFRHSGATVAFQNTVIIQEGVKVTNVCFNANTYNVNTLLSSSGIFNLTPDYRIVYTANNNPYSVKQDNTEVSFSGTGQTHKKPATGSTDKFKRVLFNEPSAVVNLSPILPANAPQADVQLSNYLKKIGFFSAPEGSKIAVTKGSKLKLTPKNEAINATTSGNNGSAGGHHGDYFHGSIAAFKRVCLQEDPKVSDSKIQEEIPIQNLLEPSAQLPVVETPHTDLSANKHAITWQLIHKIASSPVVCVPPVTQVAPPPAQTPQGCQMM